MTEKQYFDHYAVCQNENCEMFACVARREYEASIKKHYGESMRLELRISALLTVVGNLVRTLTRISKIRKAFGTGPLYAREALDKFEAWEKKQNVQ